MPLFQSFATLLRTDLGSFYAPCVAASQVDASRAVQVHKRGKGGVFGSIRRKVKSIKSSLSKKASQLRKRASALSAKARSIGSRYIARPRCPATLLHLSGS
jgi:hypothetical protein